MNLLEDVCGELPEDRSAMLAVIDRYLALPPEEKLLFRLKHQRGGPNQSIKVGQIKLTKPSGCNLR